MEWLQWPAMVLSLGAAWLTGDADASHRAVGFVLYIVSNVLWITWGWRTKTPTPWGLIVMYLVFSFLSARGLVNNWNLP